MKKQKTIESWPSVRVIRDLVARGYKVSSDDQYLIAEKGNKKLIVKVEEVRRDGSLSISEV